MDLSKKHSEHGARKPGYNISVTSPHRTLQGAALWKSAGSPFMELSSDPCTERITMGRGSGVFRAQLLSTECSPVERSQLMLGKCDTKGSTLRCWGAWAVLTATGVHEGQESWGDLCDAPSSVMAVLRRNLGRLGSGISTCDSRPLNDPGQEGFLFPSLKKYIFKIFLWLGGGGTRL